MSLSQAFSLLPTDIPNKGILFVDHEKNGRSGHGGNCLTECANGDILSFFSNVSADLVGGHGIGGWSDMKRSTDGGRTWSDAVPLDYSARMWEGDEVYSALVFSLVRAPDGTLIATLVRFREDLWVKKLPPVYLLSHDHGHTWEGPFDFDPNATVEDIAMTFDAAVVHDNTVFIAFMGGGANYCPGPFSLYASTDNGKTFSRRSLLPLAHTNYYITAGVLDDGRLIVYSYPYLPRAREETDEHHMPYVVSGDNGYTWSEVRTAHFSRRIRNPQLSEKIGDFYFLHGRSGSYGEDSGHLILYTSQDGIHWDDGLILHRKESKGGDAYSGNAVIGKHASGKERRLLIQSSISYRGSRVNENQWWVENIMGARKA